MTLTNDPSSFRDDAGQIFNFKNRIFRSIKNNYIENYNFLENQDIYQILINKNLLINSWEVKDQDLISQNFDEVNKFIEHEKLENWTYPYEWTFSQLKNAAIFHLDFQLFLLEKNISLKDASAYNIQFKNNKPIFIDILSLQKLDENTPWQGHKQFCEEFLNPLVYSSYFNLPFNEIYKGNLNGISNRQIINLLGYKIFFSFSLLINVYFTENLSNKSGVSKKNRKRSYKQSQIYLIKNLKNFIKKLKYKKNKSTWSNYSNTHSYSKESEIEKENILKSYISTNKPYSLIDMGCNDAKYSFISKELGVKNVIALDYDMQCLEKIGFDNNEVITPLYADLSNLSSPIGWDSKEKKSFVERFNFDFSLSFALIHHFVIGKNIPLYEVLNFIIKLSKKGLVEFIPNDDEMVKRMKMFKTKDYDDYNLENFLKFLNEKCNIVKVHDLKGSKRKIIYYEKIT